MDTVDRKAALTGRVGLLLGAFGCAAVAALEAGAHAPVLVVLAVSLAVAACITPLAVRLGQVLKPRRDENKH